MTSLSCLSLCLQVGCTIVLILQEKGINANYKRSNICNRPSRRITNLDRVFTCSDVATPPSARFTKLFLHIAIRQIKLKAMQILGARSGKIRTISSALNFPFCSFPGIFRKRRKIYFTRFLFSCLAIYISLYFYFLQCQPKSLAIKLILGPSSPPPVS